MGKGQGLPAADVRASRQGVELQLRERASFGAPSESVVCFEYGMIMFPRIISSYPQIDLTVLDIAVENFRSEEYGVFGVIFSNNVLEHIPDIESAFHGMVQVLSEEGVMVHSCPNYVVPFEPHLNIVAGKGLRRIAEWVNREKISRNRELWNSLNFITSFRVRKLCRRNALSVTFRKGTMYQAFLRLENDAGFSARHAGGVVQRGTYWLSRMGLLPLIKRIPPDFATPMVFEIGHRK